MLDDDDFLVFQIMSSRTNFNCEIYFTFSMSSLASMYLSMVSCMELIVVHLDIIIELKAL